MSKISIQHETAERQAPGNVAIPFEEVRRWMFDEALPFWAQHGVDTARGGFYEELDFNGAPTDVAFKRTRAICRQVYVFAHASLMGWPQGLALSEMGVDYLVTRAGLGSGAGYARRLASNGEVLDADLDLYDLAFVLFAFAWRYRAARDPKALRLMHGLLDFIDANMRFPGGEGFVHAKPAMGPRLQNPHMHLLEANLAAFEATEDQRFLDWAGELVSLFRRRFFNGATLGEYFDADWRRVAGDQGRLVEPGHQLEWAWILAQYQRRAGTDLSLEAKALVDFAETHGVDRASQATFNLVRDDGTPLDRSSRTWPNTERLKGQLAMFEVYRRDDARGPIAASTRLLLDRYLGGALRGAWCDEFDAEGLMKASAVPASTFYHVFLAFAELLRVERALKQN